MTTKILHEKLRKLNILGLRVLPTFETFAHFQGQSVETPTQSRQRWARREGLVSKPSGLTASERSHCEPIKSQSSFSVQQSGSLSSASDNTMTLCAISDILHPLAYLDRRDGW